MHILLIDNRMGVLTRHIQTLRVGEVSFSATMNLREAREIYGRRKEEIDAIILGDGVTGDSTAPNVRSFIGWLHSDGFSGILMAATAEPGQMKEWGCTHGAPEDEAAAKVIELLRSNPS